MNALLHSLSTYLVFVLGSILLPHPAQMTASLLFAVHPVHCEAVASVVGRADILANIFFILSFLSYIEHVKLRNKHLEWWSSASTTYGQQQQQQQPHRNRCFFKNQGKICKYKFNNATAEYNGKICRIESFLRKVCQFLKINIYLSQMEAASSYSSRFHAIREWFSLFLSLVLAALAMFSKETGLTVLAVCAAYDLVKTRHLSQKVRKHLDHFL